MLGTKDLVPAAPVSSGVEDPDIMEVDDDALVPCPPASKLDERSLFGFGN